MRKKWYGDKSGQGFYKKTKGKDGKTEILTLDLKTFDYVPQQRSKFATLEQTKTIDQVKDRYRILVKGTDKAGEFYRKTFAAIFAYVTNRIPEITDELYNIDAAMEAGFGWEYGPFTTWDAIGIEKNASHHGESSAKNLRPGFTKCLPVVRNHFIK